MNCFNDVYERLKGTAPRKLAVAAAADTAVLEAVAAARRMGIAESWLFGDADSICRCLKEIGEEEKDYKICPASGDVDAARQATGAVSSGKCDILMKGLLASGDFLRAVLNRDGGLRKPGTVLSAIAVFELTIEGTRRFLFLTDPGFIPLPDLDTKAAMIRNAVDFMHDIGIACPKIAALSVAEQVNPKILSSVEARALQEKCENGEFGECLLCGPISMDLAISPRSAEHKGFHHPVAGQADCLLVPSLEVGNAVLKCITYLTDARCGGATCGTTAPVVFTSRSDLPDTKLNSIAMACLQAAGKDRMNG